MPWRWRWRIIHVIHIVDIHHTIDCLQIRFTCRSQDCHECPSFYLLNSEMHRHTPQAQPWRARSGRDIRWKTSYAHSEQHTPARPVLTKSVHMASNCLGIGGAKDSFYTYRIMPAIQFVSNQLSKFQHTIMILIPYFDVSSFPLYHSEHILTPTRPINRELLIHKRSEVYRDSRNSFLKRHGKMVMNQKACISRRNALYSSRERPIMGRKRKGQDV